MATRPEPGPDVINPQAPDELPPQIEETNEPYSPPDEANPDSPIPDEAPPMQPDSIQPSRGGESVEG